MSNKVFFNRADLPIIVEGDMDIVIKNARLVGEDIPSDEIAQIKRDIDQPHMENDQGKIVPKTDGIIEEDV